MLNSNVTAPTIHGALVETSKSGKWMRFWQRWFAGEQLWREPRSLELKLNTPNGGFNGLLATTLAM
jgi:hypothetical protein